jgi:hypothetical protein
LISTKLKNLELARKTTPKKNLRSMIRTRVEIPGLNKKIEQPKKIEGCDQENRTTKEDRRMRPRKGQKKYYNMEMIM